MSDIYNKNSQMLNNTNPSTTMHYMQKFNSEQCVYTRNPCCLWRIHSWKIP